MLKDISAMSPLLSPEYVRAKSALFDIARAGAGIDDSHGGKGYSGVAPAARGHFACDSARPTCYHKACHYGEDGHRHDLSTDRIACFLVESW